MIIMDDSIKLYNFDKLLIVYSELKKANNSIHLGSRTDEVLNELSVGIKLKEINFIEFLILKQLSKNIRITSISCTEECSPHKSADEIFSLLFKLHHDIGNNINLNTDTSVLPINFLSIDVEFILKGSSILFLTNGTLEDLFTNGLNEDSIKEKILKVFPNSFYNYMLHSLRKNDFASEVIKNNLLYDYLDTKKHNSVTPIRVISSNDIIQLSGGNNKEVLRALNHMKTTNTMKDSSIEIAIYSNFWVFAKFILYSNYVVDYIPLRNVLGSDKFGFDGDLLKNYQVRITNIIKKFINERHKIMENPDMELIKYFWILCSDKIKYKLSIPLIEVDQLKNKLIADDKNTKNIIDEILRISKPFIL